MIVALVKLPRPKNLRHWPVQISWLSCRWTMKFSLPLLTLSQLQRYLEPYASYSNYTLPAQNFRYHCPISIYVKSSGLESDFKTWTPYWASIHHIYQFKRLSTEFFVFSVNYVYPSIEFLRFPDSISFSCVCTMKMSPSLQCTCIKSTLRRCHCRYMSTSHQLSF